MKLHELIKVCNAQELGELYAFWNGQGVRPATADELRQALVHAMTEEPRVRQRLRFLSRKLVDLVRYFLGRRGFEAGLEGVRRSRAFAFMSPHEVEAAVRALVKRGFLFPCRRTTARPTRFTVPLELGEVLRTQLEDLDLSFAEAFSLERMLLSQAEARAASNGTAAGGLAQELERLTRQESVEERHARLPALARDVLDRTLEVGHGLLPRSYFLRGAQDPESFPRRLIKESLESARLGTVRHLALGEYGINHFDDTILVFAEILWTRLTQVPVEVDRAGAVPRALGVDLLSDLSQFLGNLGRERVRLTQAGSIYRTAMRKIEEGLILASKEEFTREDLFQFLFDLSLSRHLIRRTPDRSLTVTSKGKTWPRLSVTFKLRELLNAVLDEPRQHFHRPRLQRLTLKVLQGLHLERWYDFHLLVGYVRQRYLSSLEEDGVREAYQSRYQYSSEAHMRDLRQLTQMISGFLSYELHLLGLVDVAVVGDRVHALRLSQLAARVLDLEREECGGEHSPRLLVNADFEVLLFPEGDSYDLIQRLDHFAERVSAENANRFRITPRSVERAVASGMTVAEILETLSENSASELPQNVVFSIRNFAEKVRFVQVQPAYLVTVRHKEVLDQLLRHGEVRRMMIERLSPRMLALNARANLEELLPRLEQEGVFLEGGLAGFEEAPGRDDEEPPEGNGTP